LPKEFPNSQLPFDKKIATVDTYFNSQVIDNYRWLETMMLRNKKLG